MAKIVVLILTSPIQFQNSDTAVKFIEAAVTKGHEVTVLAIGDGVYTDLNKILHSEVPLPSRGIKELVEKRKVRFINCSPCIQARGLKPEDFVQGSEVDGTSTIVDMISEADRTITFTL
jgi:tRNA 2-thiouridine synthesizing protein D